MIILFLHDEKTAINYAPQSFSSLRMAQRTLAAISDGAVDWESTKVGFFFFDEFSAPECAILGSRVRVYSKDAFLSFDDDSPVFLRGVKGDD